MEEDFSKKSGRLKPVFIDAITDLLDELGMVREHIAAQATEHIHSA
jgi:translation initiation factor eIF-2B subunit beta